MSEQPTYPSLKNKVVFITGGSTGIGADMVKAFARQGARVAFIGRNKDAADALCNSLADCVHSPEFHKCDVTDLPALQQSLADCAASLGDINVLINNVANDERHAFEDVDTDYFDWEINTNLRPHVFASQSVIDGMKRSGGGSIINLSSISWMRKTDELAIYATLKAAIHGLTRTLAKRLGPHRIRVNTLVPGWTMTQKQIREHLDETGEEAIAKGQCLPDKVQPEDIAAAALFLASDQSRMITAQDIIIDGGWT